jgi:threonine/homoserine/homoserine lactone efflux protein
VLEVVIAGLVTGWAIAIPIGAVGALLVALTARTSIRTGSAAALGVATVDGGYAAVAVVGGAAIATRLEPYADRLRVASALVLLGIAVLTVWLARRSSGRSGAAPASARDLLPWQAFGAFLALTAVNPTTVVYFAAVVLGNPDLAEGWAEGVVFVVAAFVASASWQLTLALLGSVLGRSVTSKRGRLVTGWVSGVVIAGLAVRTLVGG